MSLRAAALGFWRRSNLLIAKIATKTGGCFVGKSKNPPRNDICTVEKQENKKIQQKTAG
jgi:hypothetical protein